MLPVVVRKLHHTHAPMIGTFSTNIQALKQINDSKQKEYNYNDLH